MFGHVKPVAVLEKLRAVARNMKKTHATDEDTWRTAATTLSKWVCCCAP